MSLAYSGVGENDHLEKADNFFSSNGLPETNYFIKLLMRGLARMPTLPTFITLLQIKKLFRKYQHYNDKVN